jgi:hypothetical protein
VKRYVLFTLYPQVHKVLDFCETYWSVYIWDTPFTSLEEARADATGFWYIEDNTSSDSTADSGNWNELDDLKQAFNSIQFNSDEEKVDWLLKNCYEFTGVYLHR